MRQARRRRVIRHPSEMGGNAGTRGDKEQSARSTSHTDDHSTTTHAHPRPDKKCADCNPHSFTNSKTADERSYG